jgi:hypothetical protein
MQRRIVQRINSYRSVPPRIRRRAISGDGPKAAAAPCSGSTQKAVQRINSRIMQRINSRIMQRINSYRSAPPAGPSPSPPPATAPRPARRRRRRRRGRRGGWAWHRRVRRSRPELFMAKGSFYGKGIILQQGDHFTAKGSYHSVLQQNHPLYSELYRNRNVLQRQEPHLRCRNDVSFYGAFYAVEMMCSPYPTDNGTHTRAHAHVRTHPRVRTRTRARMHARTHAHTHARAHARSRARAEGRGNGQGGR